MFINNNFSVLCIIRMGEKIVKILKMCVNVSRIYPDISEKYEILQMN